MLHFSQLKDVSGLGRYRKKFKHDGKMCARVYSDTIYTFDIETTSLFKVGKKWDVFNYDLSKECYGHDSGDMIAIPYIWMFGIEDTVYYGRDFYDFEKVLKQISSPYVTKIIWVHNLQFELQFLQNIFDKYTITDMCARDIRKPISFYVQELNIEFRCSYMLTNLSLEKASEEYTNVQKKHTLEYDSKIRTELTKLSDLELEYCEYDIICLYYIIKYHRDLYKHLCKCPLTSTSKVRKALRDKVDFGYIQKMWELVPSAELYLKMMATFQGGWNHANILNSGRIFDSSQVGLIKCEDETSAYPTVMCLELYPSTPFRFIDYDDYMELKEDETNLFIMRVGLNKIKSRYYNNYISYSRALEVSDNNLIYDNGRVSSSDYVELYCTNVDLDIIKKNYEIEKIDYIEIYTSEGRYLDIRVIEFILELYQNKTSLKGIKEKEFMYKLSKAYINSLYGMSVTNPLKNSADYTDGIWNRKALTDGFVNEVLENTRQSYSTLFYYATGVFVTSYARRNLFGTIISSHEFDSHVIYADTDSIFYYGDFDYIFEEYNKQIYEKYKKCCKNFSQLKIEDFIPKDKKGVRHPLGYFEIDKVMKKFITLGAKKYCYVDMDDVLRITVSGVNKKGAEALHDISEFKKGFTWGYREARKLAHYYNDEQPFVTFTDADGNKYTNKFKHGLILQPTTYTLGLSDVYEALIEYYQESEDRKDD